MIYHTICTYELVHDDDSGYVLAMRFDLEVPSHIDHISVHYWNGSVEKRQISKLARLLSGFHIHLPVHDSTCRSLTEPIPRNVCIAFAGTIAQICLRVFACAFLILRASRTIFRKRHKLQLVFSRDVPH